MISKQRFSEVKKGELLLFKNGRVRMALEDVCANAITFQKVVRINYPPRTTVYTYSDIYKDVVGVFSSKS